jgi:hypothetical protein
VPHRLEACATGESERLTLCRAHRDLRLRRFLGAAGELGLAKLSCYLFFNLDRAVGTKSGERYIREGSKASLGLS